MAKDTSKDKEEFDEEGEEGDFESDSDADFEGGDDTTSLEFDADPMLDSDDDDFEEEEDAEKAPTRRSKRRVPVRTIPRVEGIAKSKLDDPKMVQAAFAKLDKRLSDVKPIKYSIREKLAIDTVVDHARFGKGFVIGLPSTHKAEVVFEDAMRKLVHGK